MNGDLGNDAGTVALNLGSKIAEKIFEAIAKLFAEIGRIWREHPQRKMVKMQLAEAKTRDEKLKIIKGMNGVDGYVKYKRLEKFSNAVNSPLVPKSVSFPNKDYRDMFIDLCNSNHLPWSATSKGEFTGENLDFTIFVCEKDLKKLERTIEEARDMVQIDINEKKIAEIMGDRTYAELDEVEKMNVDLLNANISELQSKWLDEFNAEEYSKALDDVMFSHGENVGYNYEAEQVSFDYDDFDNQTFGKNDAFSACLDAETGKRIDEDRFSVVAFDKDPNAYIICHGEKNPDSKSSQKIITTYEVHSADGRVKTFTDDKSKISSWNNVKEQMRAFGGFGNKGDNVHFYRFKNEQEFEKWKELANAQMKNENIHKREDSELTSAIEERKKELSDKGFEIREDGEVYSIADDKKASVLASEYKAQGKSVAGVDRTAELECSLLRSNCVEAYIIGKEIKNYEELKVVAEELKGAKTNLSMAKMGNDKELLANAQKHLDEVQAKYDTLSATRDKIVEHREQINCAQAEIQRKQMGIEYELSGKDIKKVNELANDYENLGLGSRDEFLKEITINTYGVSRVTKLNEYGQNAIAKASELSAKGEDVSHFVSFYNSLYAFQNSELARVKEKEPEVFKEYAMDKAKLYFSLDESEMAKVTEIANKCEELGIGDAQTIKAEIADSYGNERVSVLYDYIEKVSEKANELAERGDLLGSQKYIELEKELGELQRKEVEKTRSFMRDDDDTIYAGGRANNLALENREVDSDRANMDKQQGTMEEYDEEIAYRKENNPIGKSANKTELGKETAKADISKGDR